MINNLNRETEKATLAWGCFWCLESIFAELEWVLETTVWYAWWDEINPTYEQVHAWNTWHREAIEVVFNPKLISYDEILVKFWSQIDPTDELGQFADKGFSYTTAIWYHSQEQKKTAEASKKRLEDSKKFDKPIVTEILPFKSFYKAEDYHQKYYKKAALRYDMYKKWSWREDYINENWTNETIDFLRWKDAYLAKKYIKPSEFQLEKILSWVSFDVTQNKWTEKPYSSKFSENWKPWIYVDIVSGEPLFSSTDQYNAWCGWPSFTKPINSHFVKSETDYSHDMVRTEVRSKYWDSHLGHIFKDWPKEQWGLRYCINWAALKFIPKERLEEAWYGEYANLFIT